MRKKGRRMIVVFILAGVFLPLWLLASKNMVRSPGGHLSSPLTETEMTQQEDQSRPRESSLVPSAVVAVRLPPPPSPPLSTLHFSPLSSPVIREPVRITPLKAAKTKLSTPRTVALLKPAPSEQKNSKETKLEMLKPTLREAPARRIKAVRVLHPVSPQTETRPKTKSARVPVTEQKFADRTAEIRIRTSAQEVRKGRRLLKLLEHGKGPTIEIIWPRNKAERARLFNYLSKCYGMRTALLDGAGQLYIEGGRRGRKWEINLDQFSGFIRQPDSTIAPGELRAAERVRRYHGLIPAAHVIRIFPRVVDAALLGGLRGLMGESYTRASLIRGHYRKTPSGLVVEAIAFDGRNVSGVISFPPIGGSSCR